jgi:hypothetical protein
MLASWVLTGLDVADFAAGTSKFIKLVELNMLSVRH